MGVIMGTPSVVNSTLASKYHGCSYHRALGDQSNRRVELPWVGSRSALGGQANASVEMHERDHDSALGDLSNACVKMPYV